MKLKILQSEILPHLQSVSRSVGIKTTLPVLANILLRTEAGQLKLSATNLEVGVIKQVPAQVLEDGEITVPARTFLEVVSSLVDMEIQIESSTDQLKISAQNFEARLNGISAQEFPAIPLLSEKSIILSSRVLEEAIPQIAFAAAADEGRPILTGILTELSKGFLELVATDGFRLAHKKAQVERSNGQNIRVLIPRRTFEEVVRLITDEEEQSKEAKIEVSLAENQNQMIFKIGTTILSTRLIEGQFPNWQKIIPTKFENRAILEKEQLLKAVKLASVFAKNDANILRVETNQGKIKLISEAKELGGQESEIEAQVEGDHLTTAFNSKFLLEALSACSSTQVSLEFSGSLSPMLLKPVGQEGLEYVVMPIRLS